MKGYAEGTTVPVEKTQGQIQALVRKHGATMFTAGWLEGGRSAVEFTIKGRRIRWTVPPPNERTQTAQESEERRRWRCLLLGIKAKLEIVAAGISVFDEEFLAHVVTDTGATVWERVRTMPMLLTAQQPD